VNHIEHQSSLDDGGSADTEVVPIVKSEIEPEHHRNSEKEPLIPDHQAGGDEQRRVDTSPEIDAEAVRSQLDPEGGFHAAGSDDDRLSSPPADEAARETAEDTQINFDAAAELRKWPSLRSERLASSRHPSAYFLMDGSLGECVQNFMSKPKSQRHLYEIHTAPQGSLVTAILSSEHIVELNRLREFL
jgi:hypothetical protein